MRRIFSALGIIALCAMILTGAGKKESTESVTLNVFAAASLTEALNEIAELYKKAAPEVTLSFNLIPAAHCKRRLKTARRRICSSRRDSGR